MEKNGSAKQESFLDKKGRVAGHVVSENQRLDVEHTFPMREQQEKALQLIRSGRAKDALGAQAVMQKEESDDPVNDMYKR